jgi:hypothetical protein
MKIGPFIAGQRVVAEWLQWMLEQVIELTNITGTAPVRVEKTPGGYAVSLSSDFGIRTGRIKSINYDDGDPKACLVVEPNYPNFDTTTGRPKLYELSGWETDPVPDDEGSSSPNHVLVYVDGCPYELAGVYFAPGQRIKYWTSNGNGKYVTILEDDSFWAEITPDPAGPANKSKWKYKFKASSRSDIPFTGTLHDGADDPPFIAYLDPDDAPWEGECYNIGELTNRAVGTVLDPGIIGMSINSDGTVESSACVLKQLGRHFNKVYRFWNAAENKYIYYFGAVPNSAGE